VTAIRKGPIDRAEFRELLEKHQFLGSLCCQVPTGRRQLFQIIAEFRLRIAAKQPFISD